MFVERAIAGPTYPTHIPYRCNRALIFRSMAAHRTDPMDFRDAYDQRRINVTMISGFPRQRSGMPTFIRHVGDFDGVPHSDPW